MASTARGGLRGGGGGRGGGAGRRRAPLPGGLRRIHGNRYAPLHIAAFVAGAAFAGAAGLGSLGLVPAYRPADGRLQPVAGDDPTKPFGSPKEALEPPEWRLQLDECVEDGLLLDALELIKDEDNVEMREDKRSWTDVFHICAKQRRWEEACELLETMRNASEAPDPAHEEYHEVLDACEQEPLVLDMFNEMRSRGLPPNIVTVIKILAALAKQGRVEEATRIYKEAKDQSILQPWANRGIALNVQDYPPKVAEIIVRDAVLERAWQAQRKAGKGGSLSVLTGFANSKKSPKLKSVLRVLQDEFGLKARMEPARFGKITVKYEQLQRLGEELMLEGKLPKA